MYAGGYKGLIAFPKCDRSKRLVALAVPVSRPPEYPSPVIVDGAGWCRGQLAEIEQKLLGTRPLRSVEARPNPHLSG